MAHSAPDGYTMLFSSLSLLVNPILLENRVKYDPFKDFAPVSNVAVLPMVVVTSPETRLTNMRELIALAKAKPGEVMSGRVTFMFYPIIGIADFAAQHRLKVLAVGTLQPHPDLPGAPTLEEMGPGRGGQRSDRGAGQPGEAGGVIAAGCGPRSKRSDRKRRR